MYDTFIDIICYICVEYSITEAALHCKNGAMHHASDRCLYDVDDFRILKGCRDATHLENCGRHFLLLKIKLISFLESKTINISTYLSKKIGGGRPKCIVHLG